MPENADGFTLVELAIVLVIVGLLIGGILVAQSMITTVRIQSAVREIQQYDMAVSNFQTKYNSLPGDSVAFGGDGDGLIKDATGNCHFFLGEDANFWTNLQQSGFNYHGKTFSYASFLPGRLFDTTSGQPNSPMLKLDANAGVIAVSCNVPSNKIRTNTYIMSNWDNVLLESGDDGAIQDGKSILKPMNAYAIDKKMDDGIAGTGTVQDAFEDDTCSDNSQINYLPIDTATCSLSVTLLSQTRMHQ